MTEKIMLIDGLSIMNRAFYAMPPLTTGDGLPVGGVLGFLNTFFKLFDEEKPEYIAVAFDVHVPTFRHAMFGGYKGTRKPMPPELRTQIPVLKNLLALMKVRIYESPGYEADDLLGTLARIAEEAGFAVSVVSGDRDLLQIATENVCVKIPKTAGGKTETTVYYASDVLEQIGVSPKEYIDVKALMGDQSDNIPGVPGIGEKTAVKIIKEYKSVENAIENAARITLGKAAESLAAHTEQALLSKTLATIASDAPVGLELTEMNAVNIFNADAFNEIKRLEFKSLFPRFGAAAESEPQPLKSAAVYESDAEIKALINELSQSDAVAYKLLYNKGAFDGVDFAWGESSRATVKAAFADLDESRIFELCRQFFEGNAKKVAFDVKSDMHRLNEYGISLNNPAFDVMLGAYVLNTRDDFPDAGAMLNAYPNMLENLSQNGMAQLYYDVELPLAFVLYDMEKLGIKADGNELAIYGEKLGGRIDALTAEIYELAGESFNINSTKQLGYILFEKLLLPTAKKNKTGYSTAADVLERMAGEHPIIEKILEYRQLAKLKSTYADGLLAVIDKTTGKIYTRFNQAATSTGRLSSAEPNLQNIPIRTDLGRAIRKAFIPSGPDFIFMDADYSQIELRVLAHMSGDETFIEAFNNGADIHRITASEVFGVSPELVTPQQRSNAKAVNFGIIYGQSAFSFAYDLGIPHKEAERYINGYFRRYPGVKKFMEETVVSAKKNGYACTIMGRRRYFPELSSSNHQLRAFGERAAMNMPVQGSAADIIKIAMVRVHNSLKNNGLRSRLVLQVHDELLIEAHRDETVLVKQILKNEMENAVKLNVPLIVDINEGVNWYEAK